MRETISTKKLAVCAKAASKRAIERAWALGTPVVCLDGNRMLRRYPDGREELIRTLPQTYVKTTRKRYKMI